MRGVIEARSEQALVEGWTVAGTAPDALTDATDLAGLSWVPARVPGTVAEALGPADPRAGDPDAHDWWYRAAFESPAAAAGEEIALRFDGLATVAEIYLDGALVGRSESMFQPITVPLEPGAGTRELVICLRALTPRLAGRRKPRARWRTRLVSEGNLRFVRTMVIGRSPGLAAGPPAVGPYRPVWLQRRRGVELQNVRVRARLHDGRGTVGVQAQVRPLDPGEQVVGATVVLDGAGEPLEAPLELVCDGQSARIEGELTVADPALWWPHTHGQPALYAVRLRLELAGGESVECDGGRVGFRDLRLTRELTAEGLALAINGVPVFARGAVWTPVAQSEEPVDDDRLRELLTTVVRAGLNMLRVPGIACYERPEFYDLCDELGILVWQDFMFANLDYPEQDPGFMETVGTEAHEVLGRLAHRPSLAVLCGGSEVAQQVAMLGLDPALASGPLYAGMLPEAVAAADVQAPYIPSTPWGGDLPFRPDRGVANYYGVGAYLRPLEDARRSGVRFSGECLAFANVPDDDALPAGGVGGADWKRGVPRDAGAGWDFEDVRDHYLAQLYEVDPATLRYVDPERYLELSRHVTGEVMAETFGEWRRDGSPCAGGLVLWLTDLRRGPGWGLLDHRGRPKAVLHHLRRALAPVAVWSTDEGLGGIDVHVANDTGEPLRAVLRIGLYRDRETLVGQAQTELELGARSTVSHGVEALLGHFADVSWAYRFGPPAQDLVVCTLETPAGELLSQSFRHPAGRPAHERLGAAALGLEVTVDGDGEHALLALAARRFVWGARVTVPGYVADDDCFSLEPGRRREVRLRRVAGVPASRGTVTALNLQGTVAVPEPPQG